MIIISRFRTERPELSPPKLSRNRRCFRTQEAIHASCEDYRAAAGYRPQDVSADPSMTGYSVLVRFAGDPGAFGNAVRAEIHALDPSLAIFDVATWRNTSEKRFFFRAWHERYSASSAAWAVASSGRTLWRNQLLGQPADSRNRHPSAIEAKVGEVQRLIIR